MKITRDVAVWAWLVIATPLLIASSHSLAKTSVRFQQEITSLVGAPAPDCTFNSAIAELDSLDLPGMWWAEAADVDALGAAERYFRFTVGDYPKQDDRWMIEAPDLDIAACMAVERVKQLEARR